MNLLDRLIAPFSPSWALERARDRRLLAAYEAAKQTRTRRNPKDNRSGDALTQTATTILRGQARHLDQNHDIARGVLNCLVNNVVGPKGIGIEAQPKTLSGEIHKEFANALQKAFKNWAKHPETTGEYNWSKTQRMVARAWFRDGEVISKSLMGNVALLNHKTQVPLSLELLEADHLTNESDLNKNITQGVERNAWGRPTYYHLYDQHPGDITGHLMSRTRRVNADVIDHVKLVDRIRQARGVSVFAAVMNRLNDLKDYEDSERIAARIAATMAVYIKKGSPDTYMPSDPEADDEGRLFPIAPGAVFDNLEPGEDIGTIDSNRPSALLTPFRDAMLKAISAGTCTSASTVSKNYDGTYSAQRQELVEQWVNYAVLSDEFISMFIDPNWNRFVTLAIASGVVAVPSDVDRETLYDAEYICQSMPWIDPAKEAKAHETNIKLKIKSPQQIIRSAGGNPEEVLDQFEKWQFEIEQRNLKDESNEPAQAGFLMPGENDDE